MLLDVRDLSCFIDGREVVRKASFSIPGGEVVGLMGPNGSGKTTLALSLLNLHGEWNGSVHIAGRDVSTTKTSLLARDAGFVFQNPTHQLFESSVAREIAVGPEAMGMDGWASGDDDRLARIEELSRAHGLSGLSARPPQSLSHGQKRRLNLASVAASEPRLLVLDEPFIGQDASSSLEISSKLRAHAESGGAVMVILHDLELASHLCDRVIFLEDGRVSFDLPLPAAMGEFSKSDALKSWRDG